MFKKLLAALLVLSLAAPASAVTLNTRGEVAMGAGGLQGSVNGGFIPNAMGSPCWLTNDVVAYTTSNRPAIETLNLRTGAVSEVAPRGANDLMCRGGVWAGWLAGFGLFTSTGLHLPEAGLIGVGPDGELAYVPNRQVGLGVNVREVNGTEWRLTDGVVFDLQLLGGGRAIWTAAQQVFVRGIPQPMTLPGGVWRPRVVEHQGRLWLTYFSGRYGVVLHTFGDATAGYVIAPPGVDAFQHDVASVGEVIRVASSARAGELPIDLVVKDVNPTTTPKVPFTTTPTPIPTPIPTPTPTPTPQECPASNGIQNGVVVDPQAYTLSLVCKHPVANFAAVIRTLENEFYKFGFGLQTDSGGTMRGRIYLPTALCPNAAPTNAEERRLGVKQDERCWDQLGRFADIVENGPNGPTRWAWAERGGPAYQPFKSGPVVDPPPPPPSDDVAKLKAEIVRLQEELQIANDRIVGERDRGDMFLRLIEDERKQHAELQTKFDAALAEIERLKNQGCRVVGGPGWLRSLFNIRCEPVR